MLLVAPRLSLSASSNMLSNIYAGNASSGILREIDTRLCNGNPVSYKGGLRVGQNGHNGHYGVFLLNYFPGPYWCAPGSGNCVLEVDVNSATTVKSGSACRSCADDTPGTLSQKVAVRAVVLPPEDVPLLLQPR